MNTETDNLEARAREWLRENHPYTHDVHEQITKLAAFARSLAPSGAVLEAGSAMRDEISEQACQLPKQVWMGEKGRKLITLWENWDAAIASSPSVDPTVDEQKTELQEAIKEIGKLQDQIKDMDNEIRGLNKCTIDKPDIDGTEFQATALSTAKEQGFTPTEG